MCRLYGVAFLSKSRIRDLSIDFILNSELFDLDEYIHTGEFDYIIDHNNILNTDVSLYTKVYRTLSGANKLMDKIKKSPEFTLRYSLKGVDGSWIRKYNGKDGHVPVIVDITDKWDSVVDKRIEVVTNKFNIDINTLKSKKSS
mgnify:CR=1 FL=1|jgi:hypothetical protein